MDPWEFTGRGADIASAHLGLLVGLLAILGVAWLLAGIGLRGLHLAAWFAPPVLGAIALVLVAGPGRLFAKRHEGRTLLGIAPGHSVTALDVPAAVAGGLAASLAVVLVVHRIRLRPRRPVSVQQVTTMVVPPADVEPGAVPRSADRR